MKKIKNIMAHRYFWLIFVFAVALFFRFFKINSYPLSLNWDEATFAYNAYSILETGRDEYGVKLPLAFKSIGDYKCPLYVYLMVPVIKILGLNELAVRFWPSFLGALTVPLLFLIVMELFGDKKLALFSALILAISPWHLQFTRAGADVAVSSFFLILGLWLFLKGINEKIHPLAFISASLVSFVLTFYSYYAERFFVPLLLLLLLLYFRKEVFRKWRIFLRGAAVALVAFLPILGSLLSSGHQSKIKMTTIFGYRAPQESIQKIKEEDGAIFFRLFHNTPVEYGLLIADRYFNHFSPSFLFIKGPPDNRQRIEGMGMLYWSDAVLLIFALLALATGFKKKSLLSLVLLWLALGPLPAAITRDSVHARRSLNMIYPLSILLGLGLSFLTESLSRQKNRWLKSLLSTLLAGFFLWSFGLYLLSYFVFTPPRTAVGSAGWQYGYKELVEFVSPLKAKYQNIVIDTSYQGPYIYFLFYEKYQPAKYQPQAVLVKKDDSSLGEGLGYDNYHFREIYWPADRGLRKTLFAGPPERLVKADIDPRQARLVGEIEFPDGKVAFRIVETF